MPFIRTVLPDEAEGALKDVYTSIAGARGSIAHIHQISSLDPAFMQGHLDFYMTLMFGKGGLTRRERELVATAVSSANKCDYCTVHHGEAFARYEKDAEVVTGVMADPAGAALSERDGALVTYALKLTHYPADMVEADVTALKNAGFDDKDILAAAAVTGYFNFVNRLAVGLGVAIEGESDRVYKS